MLCMAAGFVDGEHREAETESGICEAEEEWFWA